MTDEQFGELTWEDTAWEGRVAFPRFGTWGAALDEKDPPDTRPIALADRSPTKRQIEARDQLAAMAQQLGGEEGAMLSTIVAGFANRAHMDKQEPPEEPDAETLKAMREFREGVCTLYIDAGRKRRREPTKAQRAAWDAVLARGDALWDELLEKSFDQYRKQIATRRTWWRAIYGDYLLDRRIPEVRSIEQFARLIRPQAFRIKSPPDKTTPAEISVHVRATWDVDGLGVILRDGKVAEFGQVISTVHTTQTNRQTIDHPVYGRLKRIASDDPMEFINEWETPTVEGESGFRNARRVANRPWLGRVRFDPLTAFANVADRRAQYAHDRARADVPRSRMRWEFASDEFELRVFAPAGQPPSAAQSAAWSSFKADEQRYAKEMIDTILSQYHETVQTRRQRWKDRYVDDVLPTSVDASGLRELIQLIEVHVHPEDGDGRVTIGFGFVAAYDYDGFCALWRDGQFVEWGLLNDASYRKRTN